MSYYHPETPSHIPDGTSKPLFSVVRFELVVNEVKESLFIFDLPLDLVVCLDNVEIPSSVFDYFNPLVVDPVGLGVSGTSADLRHGRLLFYYRNQNEPVESFSCLRLIPSQAHIVAQVLDSTVHYPPNFDIDYRSLVVSRTLRARQLCELFEKLQSAPPQPTMMVPPFPFQRAPPPSIPLPSRRDSIFEGLSPESQFGRLLSAMFRPITGPLAVVPNENGEAPPSPSPAIFLDPEAETFTVFQVDDSDRNEDDFDDEETDDDHD